MICGHPMTLGSLPGRPSHVRALTQSSPLVHGTATQEAKSVTAARAKAPTLAWLLTALACLLSGMAIVEMRRQTVPLSVSTSTEEIPRDASTGPPTVTPAPTLPASPPVVVAGPPLSIGLGALRGERLTVPRGVHVVPAVEEDPMLLMAETGALTLRARLDGRWLDTGPSEIILGPGEPLVIPGGAYLTVRNDGQAPATLLVVTIVPVQSVDPGPVSLGSTGSGTR